jgi:hypothetical protein
MASMSSGRILVIKTVVQGHVISSEDLVSSVGGGRGRD